jgi:hypothetical protein
MTFYLLARDGSREPFGLLPWVQGLFWAIAFALICGWGWICLRRTLICNWPLRTKKDSGAESETLRSLRKIMADLTSLQQQVAENTQVETSAVTLIKGIADRLKAAGTDPVALQTLQDQLHASAAALAAAIAANTPAQSVQPSPGATDSPATNA